MKNKKYSSKESLIVLTDRDSEGDIKQPHARLPIFDMNKMDLTPNELVVLSWILLAQFMSGSNKKMLTTARQLGRELHTDKNVIDTALNRLEERKLLSLDEQYNNKMEISHRVVIRKEDFRAITRGLLITNAITFKLKAFIVSLVVTDPGYIIDVGNATRMAKLTGMDRRTVTKHVKELERLGVVVDSDGVKVLDMVVLSTYVDGENELELVSLRNENLLLKRRLSIISKRLANPGLSEDQAKKLND